MSRIYGEWLLRPKYEFSRTDRLRPWEALRDYVGCGDAWLEGGDACEVKVPRQNAGLQDSELLELGEVSHGLRDSVDLVEQFQEALVEPQVLHRSLDLTI